MTKDVTLTFSGEEWDQLLAWLPYISDSSYAHLVAELIDTKVEEENEGPKND